MTQEFATTNNDVSVAVPLDIYLVRTLYDAHIEMGSTLWMRGTGQHDQLLNRGVIVNHSQAVPKRIRKADHRSWLKVNPVTQDSENANPRTQC
ncbi:hypothetical protein EV44_g3730 [Erysiphe necator]|uniref:Uncharacterized protein n=1 Tax=Uncinula necator TaxID=52586 RepID=A0A0B1P2V8_UNCNE|nr:hypothetical protein EV44_g3730 [Erysiphe necator]